MVLNSLKDTKVLLFGKSRAFASCEFIHQMNFHNIELVQEYSSDISTFIEGRMMTPYEQIESENLYKKDLGVFISIDEVEKDLAKKIDEDSLLMSLKLSHDKDRLKQFIQNSQITDSLFFKLLKLYSWSGEYFFDNDDNRDVTASIIRRFYKNIEQNHNVEYAPLGLMHLITQSNNENLIELIFYLEPIQKALKNRIDDIIFPIIRAIATNRYSSNRIILKLMKAENRHLNKIIAMRENNDITIQKKLFHSADEDLKEILISNSYLNKSIALEFIEEKLYQEKIASSIELDRELFEKLFPKYAKNLAQNSSLTYSDQEKLFALNSDEIYQSLSLNRELDRDIIKRLEEEIGLDLNLAFYKNISVETLRTLVDTQDIKVLKSLAQNENTPIDILYQLQLDRRVERLVKENKNFTKHIQTENLGWLV